MAAPPLSRIRRLLHAARCYLLVLSVYNPAGWPTIVLAVALLLLPQFSVGTSLCHLLLVLSLVAWLYYALSRTTQGSIGLRRLALVGLALGAAALYVYLGFTNSRPLAVAALLLGALLLLAIKRLNLWLRPEDFHMVWG